MTAAEQKKNLRVRLGRMRKQLAASGEKAKKDAAVFERLKAYILMTRPSAVLVYISLPAETNTEDIIRFCFENHIPVGAPKCENGEIRFYRINSFEDTEKGAFGISEPKAYCGEIEPSEDALCIVPALCFDKQGCRLGYGGGYYDRFLGKFGGTDGLPRPRTVGICYREYIFDSLPAEKHDVCVDAVLTD